jgi:hypothetical protein
VCIIYRARKFVVIQLDVLKLGILAQGGWQSACEIVLVQVDAGGVYEVTKTIGNLARKKKERKKEKLTL